MTSETSIDIAERFVSGEHVSPRKLRGAVLRLLEFHDGFHGVAGDYIDIAARNGGRVNGDAYAHALHAEYLGQCAEIDMQSAAEEAVSMFPRWLRKNGYRS